MDSILYTARVSVKGGREGSAESSDGRLRLTLTGPTTTGPGTNPEQLFAAGYGACFLSALQHVARARKTHLPADTGLVVDVSLGKNGEAFALSAALEVHLPGMDRAQAEGLVAQAHQTCPYSNATRHNIDVALTVVV